MNKRASLVAFLPSAVLLASSCHPSTTASTERGLRATSGIVYYHATIGAGPSLLTRPDGTILDERRHEPFGAGIDSRQELAGGQVGPVDYTRDPHNALNKETDAATGWSDHGARWLAPDAARWLTPDPPVKAPDPAFMTEPWGLHPYQYVKQNPILFWDPDGRDERPIHLLDVRAPERIHEGPVSYPTRLPPPAERSAAKRAQAVVESVVAPVVTLTAAKYQLIARYFAEAKPFAQGAGGVSTALSFFQGVAHAFQYNLARTQAEKDEHAGGATLGALGMTPLAPFIAVGGLVDRDLNARVGRNMQKASDALAEWVVDKLGLHDDALGQERTPLPPATDWHAKDLERFQAPALEDAGPRCMSCAR